ncbi:MAG: cation diffusion facilitator family transporter [Myxococcota bacterium]
MNDDALLSTDERPRAILRFSIASSLVLAVGFGFVYWTRPSELALAQGADSFADGLTGAGLLFAVIVSRRPPDREHPFGHHAAEPVAALMVAVLVGVLAFQVFMSAAAALLQGNSGLLSPRLAGMLALKVGIKLAFLVWASRSARSSPAMGAFMVDVRNDVVLGLVSLLGFAAAWAGVGHHWDAILALPVAVWIFGSGVSLGAESIRLLMGTAASPNRHRALADGLRRTPGILGVGMVRAHHVGHGLSVWAEVFVHPDLTVRAAHDLGERAEARLLEEGDVVEATVHVDAGELSHLSKTPP